MAEQAGPDFYDTAGVMAVLSSPDGIQLSRADVAELRGAHSVLALLTADEQWVYPTWQFSHGAVLPGLADVLRSFAEAPAWSVATWLTTPQDALKAETAVTWLQQERDLAPLVRLARRTAVRWAT